MPGILDDVLSRPQAAPKPPGVLDELLSKSGTKPAVNSGMEKLRQGYSGVLHTLAAPMRGVDAVVGAPGRAVTGFLAEGPQGAAKNFMNPGGQEKYLNEIEHNVGGDQLTGIPKALEDFALQMGTDPTNLLGVGEVRNALRLPELAEKTIGAVGDKIPGFAKGSQHLNQHFDKGSEQTTYQGIENREHGRMTQRLAKANQPVNDVMTGKQTPAQVIEGMYGDNPKMHADVEKQMAKGVPAHQALLQAIKNHEDERKRMSMATALMSEMGESRFVERARESAHQTYADQISEATNDWTAKNKFRNRQVKSQGIVDIANQLQGMSPDVQGALAEAIHGVRPEPGKFNIPKQVSDPLGQVSRLSRASMFTNPFPHILTNLIPLTYLSGGVGAVGKGVARAIKGLTPEQRQAVEESGSLPSIYSSGERLLDEPAKTMLGKAVQGATHGLEKIQEKTGTNKLINRFEEGLRSALYDTHAKELGPNADKYEIGKMVRQGAGDYRDTSQMTRNMQKMGGVFPQYHNYIVPSAVGRSVIRNPQRLESIAHGQQDVNEDVVKDPNKYWGIGGAANNFARLLASPVKYGINSPSSTGPLVSYMLNTHPLMNGNLWTQDPGDAARHPGQAAADSVEGFVPGGINKLADLHSLTGGKSDPFWQRAFEFVTGAYPNSTYEDKLRIMNWIMNGGAMWGYKNNPTSAQLGNTSPLGGSGAGGAL